MDEKLSPCATPISRYRRADNRFMTNWSVSMRDTLFGKYHKSGVFLTSSPIALRTIFIFITLEPGKRFQSRTDSGPQIGMQTRSNLAVMSQ